MLFICKKKTKNIKFDENNNFKTVWCTWYHDDVIKWNHFPRNWPFVRGIHRFPVNSPHNGQWRGALMFSLICVWTNDCVNNREAGDLRRYRAHYDVIVMIHDIINIVTITLYYCEANPDLSISCFLKDDFTYNQNHLKYWLPVCSMPNHYPNQYRLIARWNEIWNKILG